MSSFPPIYYEFDASVEMGSGTITVIGPPGAGKTTALLEYLSIREESFRSVFAGGGSMSHATSIDTQRPSQFLFEYWTARSFSNDVLSQMIHRIRQRMNLSRSVGWRKRRRTDATSTEFCSAVTDWLLSYGEGSELHLVIDDADYLREENNDIDGWLNGCLDHPAAWTSGVFLWFVSQLPRRLPSCFRYHFVGPPSDETVSKWLAEDFREAECVYGTSPLPLAALQHFTTLAVKHYRTHRPMCASVVTRDIRSLLQRVYEALPSLMALPRRDAGADGPFPVPNALDYAKVWAECKSFSSSSNNDDDTVADDGAALVSALQRSGYTCVLLAFAAFFCGAVARTEHQKILGSSTEKRRRRRRGNDGAAASPGSSGALSSSTFAFTSSQLGEVYRLLLPMCTAQIDSTEFTAPPWAMDHIFPRLVDWGVVTPTSAQGRAYHCWMPLTSAVQLGVALGINVYHLIPT